MTTKNPVLVGSGVFLALALAFAAYCTQLARHAEAALAALSQTSQKVHAELQNAQARIANFERATDGSGRPASDPRRQARTASRARGVGSVKRPPTGDIYRPVPALASNPKLRQLALESFRANLIRRYGAMYQTLKLSPAQIDKFEELMTANRDDLITLVGATAEQGLDQANPEVAAMRKQSHDQLDEALVREVDPAVPEQMAQLEPLDFGRGTPAVYPPLTSLQCVELAKLAASGGATIQNHGVEDADRVDRDEVIASEAAKILTPAQYDGYRGPSGEAKIRLMIGQFYSQQPAGNP